MDYKMTFEPTRYRESSLKLYGNKALAGMRPSNCSEERMKMTSMGMILGR